MKMTKVYQTQAVFHTPLGKFYGKPKELSQEEIEEVYLNFEKMVENGMEYLMLITEHGKVFLPEEVADNTILELISDFPSTKS